MKRKFILVIAVLTVVLMSLALVSCGHECEFKTEWSNDATHHWHDCVGKKCELVSDKAEHSWNEGEITTPATQGASGVKTFTCEVCGGTKTEPVEFKGLTEDQWKAALESSVFNNFRCIEDTNSIIAGYTVLSKTDCKFTNDKAHLSVTINGVTEEADFNTMYDVNSNRNSIVDVVKSIALYDSFKYDAEEKIYKAKYWVPIEGYGVSTPNVTIKFDDSGRIIEIKYQINTTQSGVSIRVTSTINLEYGNVTL